MPKNFGALSTEELVALLQVSTVRKQLLRRGAPIREQLLRWFQELEAPRKTRGGGGRQHATASSASSSSRAIPGSSDASSAKKAQQQQLRWDPAGIGGGKSASKAAPWAAPATRASSAAEPAEEDDDEAPVGRITMRAEAPEFVPSEIPGMPTGTVLVPCVLPPSQDGSISVPPGHVMILGAMGLPQGVPLIVPTGDLSSLEQVTQLLPSIDVDDFACAVNMSMNAPPDCQIIDASAIGMLDIPAEDHLSAANAATAAARNHAAAAGRGNTDGGVCNLVPFQPILLS